MKKAKKCKDFLPHDRCIWQSDMYCKDQPCISVPRSEPLKKLIIKKK
jgi:hypothetical protein